MQHRSTGPRPRYFHDGQLDRFHAVILAAIQELAVTRQRLDTLERVLEHRNCLNSNEVDEHLLSEKDMQEKASLDEQYIARVLRVLIERPQRDDGETDGIRSMEDLVTRLTDDSQWAPRRGGLA